MKVQQAIGRVWWFLPVLVACTQDSGIELPKPMQSDEASVTLPDDAGPPLPDADRVAECDQAPEGTPCGESGEHCVLGVCAGNLCGDGVTAGDEQCDDGNDLDGDTCTADCRLGYVCRDGRLDPGEECDDGNRIHDDSCSNGCQLVVCGNDRIDPGEECDDGNRSDGDGCSQACKTIQCGNLRVDPGESCDDRQGCPGEGQLCKADCSGCEQDLCGLCVEQKCTDYQGSGLNLFAGCRVAVDLVIAPTPMEGFIQKCTALDDCVRANDCYSAEVGPVACFCGDLAVDACQQADVAAGPCAELYPPATGCGGEENVNNCVLNTFIDLTRPSGWSNFLAECRSVECNTECARQ
jgi:cysteine-rich repeat protein